MMDIERVEKMDELLPEQFRNVDILVNNAGLALGKNSVEENVTSDIVRMMTTNVTALIIATTLFTKGMKARGGATSSMLVVLRATTRMVVGVATARPSQP